VAFVFSEPTALLRCRCLTSQDYRSRCGLGRVGRSRPAGAKLKQRPTRYPSFSGLRPSSVASSNAKKANPSRGTAPEIALWNALRDRGLRFQLHCSSVLGRPDVVFQKAKVAVFCDGDFWHGRNWRTLKPLLERRANAAYWVAKIAANRRRDAQITRALQGEGWCVVRCWEGDIRDDPERVARQIARELGRRTPVKSRGGSTGPAGGDAQPQRAHPQ
jgi:DNA mismatch endonuclease (patch repair protein)